MIRAPEAPGRHNNCTAQLLHSNSDRSQLAPPACTIGAAGKAQANGRKVSGLKAVTDDATFVDFSVAGQADSVRERKISSQMASTSSVRRGPKMDKSPRIACDR
jgi:hypothetical protein